MVVLTIICKYGNPNEPHATHMQFRSSWPKEGLFVQCASKRAKSHAPLARLFLRPTRVSPALPPLGQHRVPTAGAQTRCVRIPTTQTRRTSVAPPGLDVQVLSGEASSARPPPRLATCHPSGSVGPSLFGQGLRKCGSPDYTRADAATSGRWARGDKVSARRVFSLWACSRATIFGNTSVKNTRNSAIYDKNSNFLFERKKNRKSSSREYP